MVPLLFYRSRLYMRVISNFRRNTPSNFEYIYMMHSYARLYPAIRFSLLTSIRLSAPYIFFIRLETAPNGSEARSLKMAKPGGVYIYVTSHPHHMHIFLFCQ